MKYLSIFLLLFTAACLYSADERVIISTENAPEAVGPYSQGILVGSTLYAAGQIGLVPETGELEDESLGSESRQTLDNLRAVIKAADMSLDDVVQVQVFLNDMKDYGEFNDIYAEYFIDDAPARAVVEVSALPLGARVEVMATAVRRN